MSKELNDSAQLMYTLLSGNLDLIERALGGATPETIRMRSEVEQAWSALTADTVMPALEAVIEHFSTASTDLARYVGSLPSSGGSTP